VEYGLTARIAVAAVAEMLASMLPTPEHLAAGYQAEVRIHAVALMLRKRLRQQAAALAAPVPPAVLLAATRLVATELFHRDHVALHHPT
jgi:hypothetical protein